LALLVGAALVSRNAEAAATTSARSSPASHRWALTGASSHNVTWNPTHDSGFASLVRFRKRDLEHGVTQSTRWHIGAAVARRALRRWTATCSSTTSTCCCARRLQRVQGALGRGQLSRLRRCARVLSPPATLLTTSDFAHDSLGNVCDSERGHTTTQTHRKGKLSAKSKTLSFCFFSSFYDK
jgi:hypothetical protein